MKTYSCEYCNFSSKYKTDHTRHLNTNKHLRNTEALTCESDELVEKGHKKGTNGAQEGHKKGTKGAQTGHKSIIEHYCDYCDKEFKSRHGKKRHERRFCKVKKDSDVNITVLQTIVNEQKKQIDKLIDKVGTTNITNNTTNTIQLNNYGDEDLSYITESFKTGLLKGPFGMIPKMIEAVHFNNLKPENKNINFPNKKENKIKVFSNNKWVYKDKTETINDLVDGKYFILDTHYENICNNIDHNKKNIYEKFRHLFDEKDTDLHDQMKKECELVLLNNR